MNFFPVIKEQTTSYETSQLFLTLLLVICVHKKVHEFHVFRQSFKALKKIVCACSQPEKLRSRSIFSKGPVLISPSTIIRAQNPQFWSDFETVFSPVTVVT